MRLLMRINDFQFTNIFLAVLILSVAYWKHSSFEVVSAFVMIIFLFLQLWLFAVSKQDEIMQEKKCKTVGYLMLITSVLMIGIGMLFFFGDSFTIVPDGAVITISFSGLLSTCLMLQAIIQRDNMTPAGRFFRLAVLASQAMPLSLIIVLLLHLTESGNPVFFSCMTVVGFGVMCLCIALYMILVSSFGYQNAVESFRTISGLIRKNKLIFIRISIVKDVLLVAGKSILGVISVFFFMFVNALYSAGMGLARYIAVKMHTQDEQQQVKYYRMIGIIIAVASICYTLYSVRLFFGGKTGMYSMNFALVIALYTFVEFGINLRDAYRLRKSKSLEAKALRIISLASTLICFVLTQTAIMSFASDGDPHVANALSGIVFGGLDTSLGLYMIVGSYLHHIEG